MSDFDSVLERLLVDDGFKAALSADPGRALAGYRLSPDEIELLQAQVSTDVGGQRRVEQRTSKAGLFGLLAPMGGGAGFGGAADSVAHAQGGVGHAGGGAGLGAAHEAGLGAAHHSGLGGAHDAGLGPAPTTATSGWHESSWDSWQESSTTSDSSGTGTVYHGGTFGAVSQSLDDTADGGHAGMGQAQGSVPAGYRPHVDVDGDGRWDQYTVQGRAGGGVDVVADMDHDGRADFVGHDDNADGIIDSADYDEDHDGVLETHMTDTNGDGWMDTRSRR